MLRFRDANNDAISEHNKIFETTKMVYWGLWLKSFENKADILKKLDGLSDQKIYIADTESKTKPLIHFCEVGRVLFDLKKINPKLVPKYYRDRIAEIPIWFELRSKINQIDADGKLSDLLGVPTIYFLDYDSEGNIINSAPQRDYALAAPKNTSFVLHLSDIHLGDDHAFRYPLLKDKGDVASTRTFSEVLVEDLNSVGAYGKIGCVVISGDVVTKGNWNSKVKVGDEECTGLDLAKVFLNDLAESLKVDPNLFCMVPGNHDIVREAKADPAKVQKFLLHYDHEIGFRTLREEFSNVYKLSPLNYVARITFESKLLVLGLLNSAYLNERVNFSEYGYVGDDAEAVFSILSGVTEKEAVKILVLHHHLLPVYEREFLGIDGKISLTLDAAKILRRAQEVNVCTVLHGHQHAIKKMHYSSWSAEMDKSFQKLDRPLTLFASGSSGAKRERRPADESNSYGLIDISAQHPSTVVRRIYSNGRKGEGWEVQ